ncbi:putative drug efflux pump [Streptomyces sp. NBRC 110611]|uniref:DHA2 family efflux MFS transporter permease subunit n=1 Tax=Streptomyces sp. NBRC 110611 TaxID=1621259 RepID=UPI000830F569|nr:DHA2 family efflux MFS transporter permease subunit [Streptomyces sp. NBRC 110611]GAU67843.1 putative drug efflux pump [Streptomyces sp. NBRC 110611]
MNKIRGNPWAILVVLSLGFFMTLLDLTIVNIAIPSMIDSLHASFDEVLWSMNGYILVLAALLITAGRLGDLRGPRQLFAVGVALFTVASLACGLVDGPAELIVARVVQGLGAALLVPQTMTLIVGAFPAERRGAALGVWGAVAGVAAVAGPALGGLLVSGLGWRWIFFVNVPVGALVLAALFLVVPDIRQGTTHRLDLTGVLVSSAAVFCLTFGLTEGERYHWNGFVWALLAAAVVLFAAFVAQQRRRQDNEPLVPFALFRNRNFTAMNFVSAAVSVGVLGLMLLLSLYFQNVLHFSALKAGLALAPASLVSMALAPFAGRLTDKIDGKYVLFTGMLLTAVGMLWNALVMGPDTAWAAFLAPMIVVGMGNGCLIAPMAAVAMQGVDPKVAGAASGVLNTVRQLGSVVGSSAVGALVQTQTAGGHGGVTAMRTSMALPIGVIVLGAIACATARRKDAPAAAPAAPARAEEATVAD